MAGPRARRRARRGGRTADALAFAQGDLARLRGVLAYSSRAYDAMLQDVVALLAYERPQARADPNPNPRSLCAAAPRA